MALLEINLIYIIKKMPFMSTNLLRLQGIKDTFIIINFKM